MVKLLGLELSGGAFGLRLSAALILAALEAFLFYYLPTNVGSLASGYLPSSYSSQIVSLVSGLVSPLLPILGLVIAVLGLLGILLKGTKIYGLIIALIGATFAGYTYLFFQGGTIHLNVPPGLIQNVTGQISLELYLVMLLLIIPSLLTIVKGGVLLMQARSSAPKALAKQAPEPSG
ncbi:MAG: hypothetical protein JRN15_12815 [Nitrososphaerota archaeon]|nr:hypothetical protein [Nitrososphaerota archaeon]